MLKTKEITSNPEEEFILDDLFLYKELFYHGQNRFNNILFTSYENNNILEITYLNKISKMKKIIKYLYKYKLNIPDYNLIIQNKDENFLYDISSYNLIIENYFILFLILLIITINIIFLKKLKIIIYSILIYYLFNFISNQLLKTFKIYNNNLYQKYLTILLFTLIIILVYLIFKYTLFILSLLLICNIQLLITIHSIKYKYNKFYNTIKNLDLIYKDHLIYIKRKDFINFKKII